jgi:hypothetical protein
MQKDIAFKGAKLVDKTIILSARESGDASGTPTLGGTHILEGTGFIPLDSVSAIIYEQVSIPTLIKLISVVLGALLILTGLAIIQFGFPGPALIVLLIGVLAIVASFIKKSVYKIFSQSGAYLAIESASFANESAEFQSFAKAVLAERERYLIQLQSLLPNHIRDSARMQEVANEEAKSAVPNEPEKMPPSWRERLEHMPPDTSLDINGQLLWKLTDRSGKEYFSGMEQYETVDAVIAAYGLRQQ